MLATSSFFILGLGLLTLGAEGLVRGASHLARRWGVPSLVVGLTIVAYGTSAPELVVSAKAARIGQAGISIGNVLGSNIFNILFILGSSAVLSALVVHRDIIWREVPIMIAVTVLLWGLMRDATVSRGEGLFLLSTLGAWTAWQIRQGLASGQTAEAGGEPPSVLGAAGSLAYVLGGLGLLVLGARWLLDSAVTIARGLGVSELVIGLTIIAAGTSLPEVATSLLAAWRGERDIAVGNVVGSNIFNILGVLGLSAVISPSGLPVPPPALNFDLPVMMAASLACLPIFLTGHRISRWEGVVFLAYGAAYLTYLVLAAKAHDALPAFSALMLVFIMPLTALTLAILVYRHNHQWPTRTGTDPSS